MTSDIHTMSFENFCELNKHIEPYKPFSWRDDESDRTYFLEKARIDYDYFVAQQSEFDKREEERVGDYIMGYDGQMTRFTHRWNDGIQTGGGRGSFYFGGTGCSYSGGLDPRVPFDLIEATEERKHGEVWRFAGGSSGAHRGCYFWLRFRVFKMKVLDRIDHISRVPYQYPVVEVTESVYDNALEVLPPINHTRDSFVMGEAYSHQGAVPVYYCFHKIGKRFFCTIATIEESKKRFEQFATQSLKSGEEAITAG